MSGQPSVLSNEHTSVKEELLMLLVLDQSSVSQAY